MLNHGTSLFFPVLPFTQEVTMQNVNNEIFRIMFVTIAIYSLSTLDSLPPSILISCSIFMLLFLKSCTRVTHVDDLCLQSSFLFQWVSECSLNSLYICIRASSQSPNSFENFFPFLSLLETLYCPPGRSRCCLVIKMPSAPLLIKSFTVS